MLGGWRVALIDSQQRGLAVLAATYRTPASAREDPLLSCRKRPDGPAQNCMLAAAGPAPTQQQRLPRTRTRNSNTVCRRVTSLNPRTPVLLFADHTLANLSAHLTTKTKNKTKTKTTSENNKPHEERTRNASKAEQSARKRGAAMSEGRSGSRRRRRRRKRRRRGTGVATRLVACCSLMLCVGESRVWAGCGVWCGWVGG